MGILVLLMILLVEVKMSTLKTFYFTFGQNHTHPLTGEILKDYWIEIKAPSSQEATDKMFSVFGEKWAFPYEERQFDKSYFPKGCYEKFIVGEAEK